VTRKSLFVLSQSSGTSLATKTTLRERIRGAQRLAGDMMKGALLTGLDNLFPQTSPIVQQCVVGQGRTRSRAVHQWDHCERGPRLRIAESMPTLY